MQGQVRASRPASVLHGSDCFLTVDFLSALHNREIISLRHLPGEGGKNFVYAKNPGNKTLKAILPEDGHIDQETHPALHKMNGTRERDDPFISRGQYRGGSSLLRGQVQMKGGFIAFERYDPANMQRRIDPFYRLIVGRVVNDVSGIGFPVSLGGLACHFPSLSHSRQCAYIRLDALSDAVSQAGRDRVDRLKRLYLITYLKRLPEQEREKQDSNGKENSQPVKGTVVLFWRY
jgi:hypothetical protein